MAPETGLVALLLDFDGVIVESVEIKTHAFRALFADHPQHVEQIVALHQANAGVSRYEKFRVIYRDILREPCDEALLRRLGARFSSLVMDQVVDCPLVRGAGEFLEEFGARYALFLISGTPQNELRAIVERRGLSAHFHEVYGSPRSKTEIMRGILSAHQWSPDRVVAVGDSLTDYRAAAELRIPFIGVAAPAASTFRSIDTLVTVADLTELASRWDELADDHLMSRSS